MFPPTVTPSPAPDAVQDGPLDTRPILPRTAASAWERNEHIRAGLYKRLEEICADRRIEALVLQSPPYSHPAWVKFESWLPTDEPGITARTAMTITISTLPCHRYEAIYKVDWERHGKHGSFDHVYEFGESEMSRMIEFLRARPERCLATRQVKRILKPVQLRQRSWQLWKPKNTVTTVRRDWAATASLTSLAVGALLMIGAYQEQNAGVASTSRVGRPAAETVAPAPASTQSGASQFEILTRNHEVSGVLDQTDQRLDDGRLYDVRTFTVGAAEQVVITMRSDAFDTYLIVGQLAGGSFTALTENDDGGNDGTNSRIEFLAPAAGEYLVLASSIEQGQAGRYTLVVR
jgi:hypothetical protein